MTEVVRLFHLVVLSANQGACTLFVDTRMNIGTSDWSTFVYRTVALLGRTDPVYSYYTYAMVKSTQTAFHQYVLG